MPGLGVDIGGSGITAAPVDLAAGIRAAARQRVPTPQPSTPTAVAAAVAEAVRGFGLPAAVGVAFPAVIRGSVALTAANVDASWRGTDVAAALSAALAPASVHVLNDADAAGLAEMRFGAGRGVPGVVVVVTLGTGVGSAVFVDGNLVPNTELGHLELDGHDAEREVSDAARKRDGLDWQHWGRRLGRYLCHLESLLWPDLIVLGGGVSRKYERFAAAIAGVRAPVRPAALHNEAGIIGAALHASEAAR